MSYLKKRPYYLLQFLLLSALSTPCYANDFKIGILGFAPWGIHLNNQVTGIMWDQSREILDEANLQGSPTYAPYPRLLKQLREGNNDCAILTKNPLNAEYYNFVSYLYDLTVTVITRKGLTINTYQDFQDRQKIKIVGFPNGGKNLFLKLFNDPLVIKQNLPSQQQGPAMIKRGRIDAFVGIEKTMLYEIDRQNLQNDIIFPGYTVASIPVWLQCSKKSKLSKAQLERLKLATDNLREQGVFKKIIEKWIPLSIEHSSKSTAFE